MNYFNTTHQTGQQLALFNAKALKQEDLILNFYRDHKDKSFSPEEIQNAIESLHQAPLTSVRRAITNLTNKNNLIKTDVQTKGRYGRPSYKWTYRAG